MKRIEALNKKESNEDTSESENGPCMEYDDTELRLQMHKLQQDINERIDSIQKENNKNHSTYFYFISL